jgi:hypothetical protein
MAITVLRLTWSARAIALMECPQTRSFIIRQRTQVRQRFALCRFGLGGAGMSAGSWPLFGWIMFMRTDNVVWSKPQRRSTFRLDFGVTFHFDSKSAAR